MRTPRLLNDLFSRIAEVGRSLTSSAAQERLGDLCAALSSADDADVVADDVLLEVTARFHLGNGARIKWINVGADRSPRGIDNSWGVMVNYLYDLSAIEQNHEAFVNHGKISCASGVRRLLKKS